MKKLYFLSLLTAGFYVANAQNVGIGTTNPETRLQVEGAISTSEQVNPAAGSLSINSNISLFRITAIAGVQTNSISATAPAQGQLLIIINEDDNDATFSGSTIKANGGSNSYVYANNTWRMTGTSQVASSGTGIVTVNGGVLGTPAALSGEVTTTGAGLLNYYYYKCGSNQYQTCHDGCKYH